MRKALAGLLLVSAGLVLSPDAVPVYDGVGAPDEPYRYVGRANPAVPSSGRAPVTGARSAALQVKSVEQGPQVLLDIGPGAFRAPAGSITVTATPLEGDGQQTSHGSVDGNIYRISVTDGAVLQPEEAQGFLFLRAAVMTRPDPVIVHRSAPTDPWARRKTVRAGQDILSTPFRALGDYAVVHVPGAEPLSTTGGLDTTRLLLLGGGVLALVVLTVLVLRRRPAEADD